MSGSLKPFLKIAIYRTTSIGDVVLASSCLNTLNQLRDIQVEVIWFGRDPSMKLLQRAFPNITCMDARSLESKDGMKSNVVAFTGIHLVLDLQKSARSFWACRRLAKMSGATVHTWPKNSLSRSKHVLLARVRGRSRPTPETTLKPVMLQIDRMNQSLKDALKIHLPLAHHAQIDSSYTATNLSGALQQEPKTWAKELSHGKWLAVAPGASYQTKRAPEEVFEGILETFKGKELDHAQEDVGLVFLGDQNDRQVAVNIVDNISWNGPILNLAGKIALDETPTALSAVEVLLSNDSSLAHVAEAVGTPVACLFGPTAEVFGFAPWRRESKVFSVAIGCRPCSKHGKEPCRFGDQLCFRSIPKKAVADFIASKFNETQKDAVK